jgi:cytochrome c peroxidase
MLHRALFLGPLLLAAFTLSACGKRDGDAARRQQPAAPLASAAPAPSATELSLPALPEVPIPDSEPQTEAKVRLGNLLFFDTRLSVDGSVSCYSCHQNEHGNGGGTPLAVGALNKQLTRHSPTIWNVGYLPAHYWDGRAATLEDQALGAWAGGNMGVGKDGLEVKAKELAALPDYAAAFAAAFPGEPVSPRLVARALSAYERTLVCRDTAYDRFAAGDKNALDAEQRAGLELFLGKAMCSACHAPPHFSVAYAPPGAYFNVGVGTQGVPREQVDVGRMAVSKNEADFAAFKPPTLRNVTRSAPYFHDGHVASLREAIRLMATGGYPNERLSPLLADRKLTEEELDALVAFLGALECGGKLEPLKRP